MRQIALGTLQRERLVNAAHRLARLSPRDPLKLFRLLYALDLRHFRETGDSCTGETYYALADGPAPGTLRPMLAMRDLDLGPAIAVLTATSPNGPWGFDPGAFTSNGLAILAELEGECGQAASDSFMLADANAWWRVYNNRGGVGAAIPYEMTVASPDGRRRERPRVSPQN